MNRFTNFFIPRTELDYTPQFTLLDADDLEQLERDRRFFWQVFSMVLGVVFLGLLFLASTASACAPPVGPGDWKVPDSQSCDGQDITLTGDLRVLSTGDLTLTNSIIRFDSSVDGEFGAHIHGELSTSQNTHLTTNVPTNAWSFQVYDGGVITITDSIIEELGYDTSGPVNYSKEALSLDPGANASFTRVSFLTGYKAIRVGAHDVLVDDSTFSGYSDVIIQHDLASTYKKNLTVNNSHFEGGKTGIQISWFEYSTVNNSFFGNQTGALSEGVLIGGWLDGNLVGNCTFMGADAGVSGGGGTIYRSNFLDFNNHAFSIPSNHEMKLIENTITGDGTNIGVYVGSLPTGPVFSKGNVYQDLAYGIYARGTVNSYNDSFVNNTYFDYFGKGGGATPVATFDNSTVDLTGPRLYFGSTSGTIDTSFYYDVKVEDSQGAAVSGASVTFRDVNDDLKASGTTGVDGWARLHLVPDEAITKPGGTYLRTSHQDYEIKASKDGATNTVTMNLSGGYQAITIQLGDLARTTHLHLGLFNAYTGKGMSDEALRIWFSTNSSSGPWTRIYSFDFEVDFTGSLPLYLRVTDYLFNETINATTIQLVHGHKFVDFSIPLVTLTLDPPYPINTYTITRNGREVGLVGTIVELLGGMPGDSSFIYTISWTSQKVGPLPNGTTGKVLAGSVEVTAEGAAGIKGLSVKTSKMKLIPDSSSSSSPLATAQATFTPLTADWFTKTSIGQVTLTVALFAVMLLARRAWVQRQTDELKVTMKEEFRNLDRAEKRERRRAHRKVKKGPGNPAELLDDGLEAVAE